MKMLELLPIAEYLRDIVDLALASILLLTRNHDKARECARLVADTSAGG